jgi:hypothetical protein
MTFEDFYKNPADPAKKRGPHHLKLTRGLNTDRKSQNIVAKMHQIDSSEHPLIRKLKSLQTGKEVIHNPRDAQKIAGKYGINLQTMQPGERRDLGNKTSIAIMHDPQTGKYILVK